jgi:hypothetical protein
VLAQVGHGMAVIRQPARIYAMCSREDNFQRGNIFVFTFVRTADLPRFLQISPAFDEVLFICAIPKRPIAAYRQTPISHSALRIDLGYQIESVFRRGILERMQKRYTLVKKRLGLGLA